MTETTIQLNCSGATTIEAFSTLSTSSSSESDKDLTANISGAPVTAIAGYTARTKKLSFASATPYYLITKGVGSGLTNIYTRGDTGTSKITAIPAGI